MNIGQEVKTNDGKRGIIQWLDTCGPERQRKVGVRLPDGSHDGDTPTVYLLWQLMPIEPEKPIAAERIEQGEAVIVEDGQVRRAKPQLESVRNRILARFPHYSRDT